MLDIEKYTFAFQISPVPMLLVSQDGEIQLSSALANKLFEYEDGQLNGENIDILVPDSIRKHHPQLRNAYFKAPVKRTMGQGRDLVGATRSGKMIPLEVGLDTVTIDGALYALVVVLDISLRRQQEQHLVLAMDAAASAMLMVNQSGVIIFVNKASIKLFGYDKKELLNQPIEHLVPDNVKPVHTVYRNSFISSDDASREMSLGNELHARHKDGHLIPVEISLTPVQTVEGKVIVSTIIDQTARLEYESAIREKSQELADVNVELTQFAYSASHDLKAPLSSITGLLGLCIDDLEDGETEEVRENLAKCLEISHRSAEKIEGVLNIAKAGSGQHHVEIIEFEPIARDMWLDLTGEQTTDTHLTLELSHQSPLLLELPTLKVILENLLSNAIRYRDPNKDELNITIATRSEVGHLHISVIDNGIGISEENQKIVFEMFSRIDELSKDGLGLALVKKQIDRLGGSISCSSEVNIGTEFAITLPINNEDKHENPSNSS